MKNQLFTFFATFIAIALIGILTPAGVNAQCADDINWTGLSGVTVSGSTITKTGGSANSWSSGAYDLQAVGPGGFVQFQAGETNTYKMIGLNSDPATDQSYCSIDYAWYPRAVGDLYIYENCGSVNIGTPAYSTSDVFKIFWNPLIDRIEYYRNNVLEYTSTNVPSGTLYVDISLYTSGASFTNVIVQGGACPCGQTIMWTGADGNTTIEGSTITKTAGGNGWSSGAYSLQQVTAGGYVEFQAGQQNTYKMIGLNADPSTDQSYCSIDYAWYPYNGGGYQIYESCNHQYSNSTIYSPSDVWKIYWNPTNNRIEYYRNNVLQYTSANIPSGTLYVDISLYTQGASFTNVVVGGSACPIPTMSTWGLIVLTLLSIAVLSVGVNMKQELIPTGVSTVALPVVFIRSMPLDTPLLARILIYLLPITVAGFMIVHFFIGTNGALDFTGTLVSACIVGYIMHLVSGSSNPQMR